MEDEIEPLQSSFLKINFTDWQNVVLYILKSVLIVFQTDNYKYVSFKTKPYSN